MVHLLKIKHQHLPLLHLALSVSITFPIIAAATVSKPGCQTQCGNITIPYPFGIGVDNGCCLNPWYNILCATSFNPPRAFSPVIIPQDNGTSTMTQILSISTTQIRIKNHFVAYSCYNITGGETSPPFSDSTSISYQSTSSDPAPYRLSATDNKLVVIGCNDYATLSGGAVDFGFNQAGSTCPANCSSPEHVVPGNCNGNGCCEASVQNGLRYYSINLDSGLGNHTGMVGWDPCGYAFVGEKDKFEFRGASDLNASFDGFVGRVKDEVPVVLDWVIGNQTCNEAKKDDRSFLCKQANSACVDADPVLGGYLCTCNKGYQGNPYLPPGCTDIDECGDEANNPCKMRCVNTPGSYNCTCPPGYKGDGKIDGTGCNRPFPIISVALGASFSLLVLIIGVSWMLLAIRQRRQIKKRNNLFQQNGGLLLKQLIPNDLQSPTIFTTKELMSATNNFSEDNILGTGGYGTVYKGFLGNQVVAIKKSKIVDESQIEQFINELVVLTRINHPNVVKLLGCCLESEVPLLVYEFISNGTLYDQIHDRGGPWSTLSWKKCLTIASEAAQALSYLHSIPIIHRDIKSMNILLDDNNTAKISDFGISRLIPMDKTRLATLVQGTLGYLDPEYFYSSELTSKSDVYSFGVVLAELLTREAPILDDEKLTEERNLSIYFVKSMKAGRLIDIIDRQLVKEASQDDLIVIADLVQSCLSSYGKDRPTMEKVAMMLQELCKLRGYQ